MFAFPRSSNGILAVSRSSSRISPLASMKLEPERTYHFGTECFETTFSARLFNKYEFIKTKMDFRFTFLIFQSLS